LSTGQQAIRIGTVYDKSSQQVTTIQKLQHIKSNNKLDKCLSHHRV